MDKKESQDIINYEQETVKVIKDPELMKFFYNGHAPVLFALREGPLTVKEIEQAYNSYIKIEVEKDSSLSREEKEKKIVEKQRSEKSIYRYLTELHEAGLVVKAGQRVVTGKTATETLYWRTARIFLLEDTKEGWWKCAESRAILDRLSRLISITKGISPPSVDCLAKLLDGIDKDNDRAIFQYLEDHYNEVASILVEGSFKEGNALLKILHIINLLERASVYSEEYQKCLNKKK
ncbi:MAG: hypothetical protein ACTSX6_12015 [Candidatus Heimdallarchaeaceae archaeon]